MTTYNYVTIDGEKVETSVAAAFEIMAAAFKKEFDLDLLITSGMRTTARQIELYNSPRYKAAKPGTSQHEDGNPKGPRALDLRDSGSDQGVQYAGTVRSNWMASRAPGYGFLPAGLSFNFVEPWHFEWNGSFDQSTPPAPTPAPTPSPSHAAHNKFGLNDVRGLQKVSAMYAAPELATAIDNDWGPLSEDGFDRFLQEKYGNSLNRGLALWLRTRWGYEGDDVYGPNMKAALKRANDANFKAL